jgi:hypothetical protein
VSAGEIGKPVSASLRIGQYGGQTAAVYQQTAATFSELSGLPILPRWYQPIGHPQLGVGGIKQRGGFADGQRVTQQVALGFIDLELLQGVEL